MFLCAYLVLRDPHSDSTLKTARAEAAHTGSRVQAIPIPERTALIRDFAVSISISFRVQIF